MNRIARIFMGIPIRGVVGKLFNIINFKWFMKYAVWYYRKIGINIKDGVTYICPDVYFDSAAYSSIFIERGVTISREVLFLVHDYSVHTAMVNVGWNPPPPKKQRILLNQL